MVLIDTSSWIHFLRPDGDAAVRARVAAALDAGTARWCPLIRLELWNGAGGDQERKVLRSFERLVPELTITGEVWMTAYDLARRCRAAGKTVPATDLLIAACARHHVATLEHADADFDAIAHAAPAMTSPWARRGDEGHCLLLASFRTCRGTLTESEAQCEVVDVAS